tara:strand:+ start:110 stop:319 length:210 start_codon:yes stop_codon:yes gene_type:complete
MGVTNMTEPKTETRGTSDLEYRIDYLTNQNKFLKDKLVKAAENLKIYKEVLRKEGEPSFIDQLRKEGKL